MNSSFASLRSYDELHGKTFCLGVGAMKCGTSWLNAYLAALDKVESSPLKEVHFFDSKFSRNDVDTTNPRAVARVLEHIGQEDVVKKIGRNPYFQASIDRLKMVYDDNEYFGHFARICRADTEVLCEVTPTYANLGDDGFRYLKSFFGSQSMDLKIIFLLRDPVDRLWSQLRFMVERNAKVDLVKNWRNLIANPRIIQWCDYKSTIENLDRNFAADQVRYYFFESLFEPSTLEDICNFIGAGFKPIDSTERRNETSVKMSLAAEMKNEFMAVLTEQYEFCQDRFCKKLPDAWRV